MSVGVTDAVIEESKPPPLSDFDKTRICTWNKDPPVQNRHCLSTLIHEQCLSQPKALAVCAWDGELNYVELEDLSSALAQHLIALGVGRDVFVPLCFEKSRWTTVAILGIIKAGGAFVLLDPSHPEARLVEICQKISAKLIISSSKHAELAARLITTVIEIKDQNSEWLVSDDPWTPSPTAPEDALYAVFTSGSTGTPKGVVSNHSSFGAAIHPYTQAVELDEESRVFQFASYAFDVTIFDILMTLINGGCICVPSDDDRWGDITTAIQRTQATHCSFTPTVARILEPKNFPTLRTLVLGGEKLEMADFARWVGHVRVLNLYGASECSIMSIQQVAGEVSALQTLNYETGSRRWIVDPDNHDVLLPIGTIGELVIEGCIVGRGYIGPENTAAKFIQPPIWLRQFRGPEYCIPVYKSGDLAQYTTDGSVRFIGRKDTQVKLRGQRIELGDVEHHIRLALPDARDVVAEVVTFPDSSRPPTLVAFIHARNDSVVKSGGHTIMSPRLIDGPSDSFRSRVPSVQSTLQQSLPSYMVPSVFLPLESLPLTSTDKINRKLLRESAAVLSKEELEQYQPTTTARRIPLTDTEKFLHRCFCRVLRLEPDQVGAEDHFFHRGGDSLMAMELVAMARRDKYMLTVRDIFEHPQLSALACAIQSGVDEDDEAPPTPFSLVGGRRDVIRAAAQQCCLPIRAIEDIYPCTPLQCGLMSETMRDPKAFVANISLPLPRDIDLPRLKASWLAVAAAHPILRTRVVLSPSHGLLQVVVREDIEWTGSKSIGDQDFSVGVGKPLVRLHLCSSQNNDDQTCLLLNIHHAIYDGWTLPLIFKEVDAAYHGRTPLPRPITPFIRYLQSTSDSTRYWSTLVEGFQTPVFPPLPDKEHNPSPRAIINTTIKPLSQHSKDFTPNAYVRLAWAITQAQCQGTKDVCFGVVVSGRNAPVANIESMTIPTIAAIPYRIVLYPQLSVYDSLLKVQSDTISGIPFEQFGLTEIRRLGEDAILACSFQTLLVMQPGEAPSKISWIEEIESELDYQTNATYAISLICKPEGNKMKVTVLYNPDVVKEDKMRWIITNFGDALQVLHQNPSSQIRDILNS
ncbi:acetyl-CoA synthetase-like protein [Daldinia vernicosa]|uniref:acetyl-CoA synthetase-like protein n=1 Tax=Daldinia vernicosa TaxID=114800 RepID=UPI002007F947|nr:acetyl-CoA synthetase-like protein [Daldinia vernicosa]KAI0849000.1 acetyl-CoA synthetase-like protein [Daldinia vernicosa]